MIMDFMNLTSLLIMGAMLTVATILSEIILGVFLMQSVSKFEKTSKKKARGKYIRICVFMALRVVIEMLLILVVGLSYMRFLEII
jgi:hypothetical protein